jgi:NADH-quinone oxidoreductase subunit C
VTAPFVVVVAGSDAAPGTAPATTPHAIAYRGAPENPSVTVLRARFAASVRRVDVLWGDTSIVVDRARLLEIVRFLHDDPTQRYDYLVDVTAVEFRDLEQPIEVVWHLRSLPNRRFLRVKVLLSRSDPLEVDSVWPVYRGADWLERECFDMFGIRFRGHPDLRRILMWEQYGEGHPLRKDFPLRGRFSRSEQLARALAANPEARYSMEELSIADAFEDLPSEMRARLAHGERTGE